MSSVADDLRAAREAVESAAASAGRAGLLELLVNAEALAEREPVDVAALRGRVELMVPRAVVMATDGQLSTAGLSTIASLARAVWLRQVPRLAEMAAAPLPVEPLLVAARDLPELRRAARARYTPAPPDAALDTQVDPAASEEEEPETRQRISVPAGLFDDDRPPRLHLVRLDDERPPESRSLRVAAAAPIEPAELPAPAPAGPVTLDAPEPPMRPGAVLDLIVDDALEGMRGLARDRRELPSAFWAGSEDRLLAAVDAIAITGDRVIDRVLGWWSRSLESPGAWASWVAPFVLGCLDGADALLAALHGVEALPEGAARHGALAAAALASGPHPRLRDLGEDLLASPAPVARATGVELMAHLGTLEVDGLRRLLLSAEIPVVAAAARATARLGAAEGAPLLPMLRRWLAFPAVEVAWPVALTLLRWGTGDAVDQVRSGGPLVPVLGVRALDVLVLAGDEQDAELFANLAASLGPSQAQLSAIARFGDPRGIPRLLAALGDEALVEAAVEALLTLAGARTSPDEQRQVGAWRAALATEGLSAGTRYRRGAPWSPAVVAEEMKSGSLGREALQSRLEELQVRAGLTASLELSAFWPRLAPGVDAMCGEARRLDRGYRAGSYRILSKP